MKRFLFILSIIVNCQLSIVDRLCAQTTFTERLQQSEAGRGTVRLHHDADIEALLYSRRYGTTKLRTSSTALHHSDTVSASVDTLMFGLGRKVRMNGYRVQVYAGGNSRDAKHRAYQIEGQVKACFPDQPVYTRFVSPRWICHVGDFCTREEALELLQDMRRTGLFPEAITVRCKINAYVYE